MKKIGVFFAPGFEEIEALTVVDVCRRAGIEVEMISVEDTDWVEGSHGIRTGMDQPLSQVDTETLDMLVLPGGMPGTVNLERCVPLMEALDRFYQTGRWVAAICAAPRIFAHRGFLEGRRATIYPGMEQELEGAAVTCDGAVTDGHVITGRGMGCAIDFALSIVEALQSFEAAGEISKSIVYER